MMILLWYVYQTREREAFDSTDAVPSNTDLHAVQVSWVRLMKLCQKFDVERERVKSFPSQMLQWGGADLRFLNTQPDTADMKPLIRGQCIVRCACLLPSFRWY